MTPYQRVIARTRTTLFVALVVALAADLMPRGMDARLNIALFNPYALWILLGCGASAGTLIISEAFAMPTITWLRHEPIGEFDPGTFTDRRGFAWAIGAIVSFALIFTHPHFSAGGVALTAITQISVLAAGAYLAARRARKMICAR